MVSSEIGDMQSEFIGLEEEVGYTQSIDMQAGAPVVILVAAIWVYANS